MVLRSPIDGAATRRNHQIEQKKDKKKREKKRKKDSIGKNWVPHRQPVGDVQLGEGDVPQTAAVLLAVGGGLPNETPRPVAGGGLGGGRRS